jgi:hypothetical protein
MIVFLDSAQLEKRKKTKTKPPRVVFQWKKLFSLIIFSFGPSKLANIINEIHEKKFPQLSGNGDENEGL